MINVRELRIGNRVNTPRGIKVITFLNIDSEVSQNIDSKPIQITEEWLLKFGFEKMIVENYPIFILGNFMIEFYELESLVNYMNTELINIHYVHQLQNLYFALTQTELTLS